MTVTEAEISFEQKKNRKKSRSRSGGGNKKNPDRVRLCGLLYLVVDDNLFARATVKDALHGIGIRNIVEMEDAEEALGYVGKHPVNVIVADFKMSGMNGAEFVWRLRRSQDERVRRIPVIMVSDHADEGHIRLAINTGVSEYIPKPFSQKDLYARLRRSVISPKPFVVTPGYIGPDRRILNNGTRNSIERRCGLSPSDLLDEPAGPETKQVKAVEPEVAAANAEATAAQAKPTANPKPSYSVLSEADLSGINADNRFVGKPKERIGN